MVCVLFLNTKNYMNKKNVLQDSFIYVFVSFSRTTDTPQWPTEHNMQYSDQCT